MEPVVDHNSSSIEDLLWERACSRKRLIIQHRCRQTQRFREQARSHIGFVLFRDYWAQTKTPRSLIGAFFIALPLKQQSTA
ncbi:hypothetical protein C1884_13790 [Pseudomonas sp. GW460-R15]|nr:hypothetical protein C1887_15945 [Pseudomonas sp. GW456-R21]POA66918.1 hypothetical protein C1884_13790 [Pseudomonas sp. GW460-R15]